MFDTFFCGEYNINVLNIPVGKATTGIRVATAKAVETLQAG